MLQFNNDGFLIPPSIIKSTIDEFKNYFAIDGSDSIREILFGKYRLYTNNLKNICGDDSLKQWIDGSFVTKKMRPVDIDLVTFINFETAIVNENDLKEFIYPESLAKYGVDGYIIMVYPEDHQLHYYYKADRSYWINHFDKTKPNRRHERMPKGFLEIIV